MSFLDQLNPQQREAVDTTEGAVLILAGAGSGKTRVITYRIAHLIEDLRVAPESILAMTFTNKAAAEMAERVDKMVGGRAFGKPVISTFHSFCVRVLRRDVEKLQVNGKGLRKDFVIYDETDQAAVVKSAMRRLGIDHKQTKPAAILSKISWAKNHMMDPQDVYLNSGDPKTEQVAHIYNIYKQELAKSNAMDFDDLLLEAVRLLKSVPEVREHYNRRFHYVMVDEYQDTNRPQYEMMRMLAGERKNICAVGDEDQSIYSWRGADIRNILEFEQDFPNAKIVRLEQNYRSTECILQAASAVVANNLKRKGKNLWSTRQGGNKIGFYEAPDGENEALFVADYISKYARQAAQDGEPAKAAVLYRINSTSRLFEEALRRYGLKYHVVGGFSFYERSEIKDMVSYLKVVHNPDDSIALQRVVNTPTRGLGKQTMETVERLALETGMSMWNAIGEAIDRKLLPLRALNGLKAFREIICDARAMMLGKFEDQMTATSIDIAASVPHVREANVGIFAEDLPPKPAAIELPDENIAFEFGANEDIDVDLSDISFGFGAGTTDKRKNGKTDNQELTEKAAPETSSRFYDFPISRFSDPQSPDHLITRSPDSVDPSVATSDLLKFLIDRTDYVKMLETEDTPESQARIDNIHELVNAALDSKDRGETLGDFLDHAALVSDADQFDENAQITLMTLHAAKGLEFPLVFLVGLEEGLFPHSRTFNDPDQLEEERRLCYVGMTRAMNTLVVTRARYRRRWGTDSPEASIASRFLEEMPEQLVEDIGSPRPSRAIAHPPSGSDDFGSRHPDYENEDQSATWHGGSKAKTKAPAYTGKAYNSIDNIAEFFASRGKKFSVKDVKDSIPDPTGRTGFRPGQRVRHPKYGEGTVYQREGEGDSAKITVQFPRFGLKKLVEKYAQLERA
jgi:DNA helicase II / ATP-dependent DNA helicase PcrA